MSHQCSPTPGEQMLYHTPDGSVFRIRTEIKYPTSKHLVVTGQGQHPRRISHVRNYIAHFADGSTFPQRELIVLAPMSNDATCTTAIAEPAQVTSIYGKDEPAISPFNTVYLSDARDMSVIPNGSVDLIVTSPPYFNIKDYAKDGHQHATHSSKMAGQLGDIAEFSRFIAELLGVWKECFRVLKPNGKLAINVPLMPMLKKEFSTHENRHIFDLNAEIQASILREIPGIFLLDTYIWNRTNPSKSLMFGSYPYPGNLYAQNTSEFISVYVKRGKSQKRTTDAKAAAILTREEWVNFTKQIWDIPIPSRGDLAYGKHSAIMPEEIVRRLTRMFTYQGDVVLDPFTGSGTTLRVAKELGRRWVGFEIVESYAGIINAKLGADCCQRLPVAKIAPIRSAVLNQIEQSDCLDYLARVPDGVADLVCVDPPYNLGKATWDTWPSDCEFLDFTRSWLTAVLPKIRPGGALFVFNTPRNAAHILAFLEEQGMCFRNWITWDKRDGLGVDRSRFTPRQETILYFTMPGGEINFDADAVRIPYESSGRIAAAARTGILKNGKRWFPNPDGRLAPDVWHIVSSRHKEKVNGKVVKSDHPTPKPFELIERIVLATTLPGDVVLDCFAGTGTTALVAAHHGRKFYACDAVAEFVEIGCSRLASVISEPESETA